MKTEASDSNPTWSAKYFSRRLITERATGIVRLDRRVFGSWPSVALPCTSMAVDSTMIRDRRTWMLALVSPTASPQRSSP